MKNTEKPKRKRQKGIAKKGKTRGEKKRKKEKGKENRIQDIQ